MERVDYNDQGVSIWMQQKMKFTPWVQSGFWVISTHFPLILFPIILLQGRNLTWIVQTSPNLFRANSWNIFWKGAIHTWWIYNDLRVKLHTQAFDGKLYPNLRHGECNGHCSDFTQGETWKYSKIWGKCSMQHKTFPQILFLYFS